MKDTPPRTISFKSASQRAGYGVKAIQAIQAIQAFPMHCDLLSLRVILSCTETLLKELGECKEIEIQQAEQVFSGYFAHLSDEDLKTFAFTLLLSQRMKKSDPVFQTLISYYQSRIDNQMKVAMVSCGIGASLCILGLTGTLSSIMGTLLILSFSVYFAYNALTYDNNSVPMQEKNEYEISANLLILVWFSEILGLYTPIVTLSIAGYFLYKAMLHAKELEHMEKKKNNIESNLQNIDAQVHKRWNQNKQTYSEDFFLTLFKGKEALKKEIDEEYCRFSL